MKGIHCCRFCLLSLFSSILFFVVASLAWALPASDNKNRQNSHFARVDFIKGGVTIPEVTPTALPVVIPPPGKVIGLPGLHEVTPEQYAGQVKVNDCGDYLFFWLITSRGSLDDPLIVWLNGGPGASSAIGLFQENGPFSIEKEMTGELSLVSRPTSWNTNANYLIIDQPAGTGFSFSVDRSCDPMNEITSTEQLYNGLQTIFQSIPDSLRQNDLYIFGESFAGHYIPRLANYIVDQNEGVRSKGYFSQAGLNLKGIGIGDGWVDPETQLGSLTAFAFDHGIIDEVQRASLQSDIDECETALHKYDNSTFNGSVFIPAVIGHLCDGVVDKLVAMTGVNIYNMDKTGGYSSDIVAEYLNQKSVREALHVSTATPDWVVVNPRVAADFETGEQNSMLYFLADLLNNSSVRIVLYGGMLDGCCGPSVTNDWLSKMVQHQWWKNGQPFINSPYKKWVPGGSLAGFSRDYFDNSSTTSPRMTQYAVYDAGHLLPMDQPGIASIILNSFIGTTVTP